MPVEGTVFPPLAVVLTVAMIDSSFPEMCVRSFVDVAADKATGAIAYDRNGWCSVANSQVR